MTGQYMNRVDMELVSKWYETHKNYSVVAELVSKKWSIPVVGSHVRYWLMKPQIKFKQKVLLFDIETSPIIAYVWGTFKQNVSLSQIKQDWQIMMFAAKWLDSDKTILSSQRSEIVQGGGTEEHVVHHMWELLDEADVVVAHNAKNFDVKKVNAKFLEYNMLPPSHYKVVDTLSIAKYNFGFTSNKLDYIATLLEEEGKNSTDFNLWIRCMDGDMKAWKEMEQYCVQDVKVLEAVYNKLRAWDKKHPKIHFDDKPMCNVCGNEELLYVQDAHTAASTFEVYQCSSCGHQQRSRVNIASPQEKKHRQVGI